MGSYNKMHLMGFSIIMILVFTPGIISATQKITREILVSEMENATNACGDGWLLIPGEGCFYFDLENEMDWFIAEQHCQELGGYLPENVDSQLEEILVEYTLLIGGEDIIDIWLGATDIGNEGHWIWIHSDTQVTEFFWRNAQPYCSTTYGCNCMALKANAGSESDSGWWDEVCTYSNPVVCQKPSEA